MAKVILFGQLQSLAGWREREIQADSLDALRTLLAGEDADLGARLAGSDVFAVVNRQMVRGDHPLEADDEVAFAPPVSGG